MARKPEHRWKDDGFYYRALPPGRVEQSNDGTDWWDFLDDEDSVPGVEILRLAARERRLLRLLKRARAYVEDAHLPEYPREPSGRLLRAIDREVKRGH